MLLSDKIIAFQISRILSAPKRSQEAVLYPDLFYPLPTTPFAFNRENQVAEDEENAFEHWVLRSTVCL